MRTPSHLRLVPAVATEPAPPTTQVEPLNEAVFEWHGHVEHGPGETPCCHQRIEVTNLIGDHHAIAHDVVAELSTVLHEWSGCDVTVLVSITPPAIRPEGLQRPL